MFNDMHIAMMRGDTMSGKPSSGSYVNQIHDNITLVFEAAKAEGILAENPCDKVTPPKMDTRAKKAVPPDKARAFIDSLDPSNPPRARLAHSRRDGGSAGERYAGCHGATSTLTAGS